MRAKMAMKMACDVLRADFERGIGEQVHLNADGIRYKLLDGIGFDYEV